MSPKLLNCWIASGPISNNLFRPILQYTTSNCGQCTKLVRISLRRTNEPVNGVTNEIWWITKKASESLLMQGMDLYDEKGTWKTLCNVRVKMKMSRTSTPTLPRPFLLNSELPGLADEIEALLLREILSLSAWNSFSSRLRLDWEKRPKCKIWLPWIEVCKQVPGLFQRALEDQVSAILMPRRLQHQPSPILIDCSHH